MAKKKSSAGKGKCGNPFCNEPKAPERYVCAFHADEYARIRDEFETDPLLLYNQRSTNPNRDKDKKTRRPKTPTCCKPGCYEMRVPPAVYCFAHENEGGGDE